MKLFSNVRITIVLGILVIATAAILMLVSCGKHPESDNTAQSVPETETETAEESTTAAADTADLSDLIKVIIRDDNGLQSVYYGVKGVSLSDIVEFLGIRLETGENLSSALTEIINKSMTIDINRIHKFLITADGATNEFSLAGGTVADALKAAGIVLRDVDEVNLPLTDKLAEGMEISVTRGFTEEELAAQEAARLAQEEAWQAEREAEMQAEEAARQYDDYDEDAARRAEEEDAARRAEEEEAARRAEEEEAARRAEEEASRKAEEEAADEETAVYIVYEEYIATPDDPEHGVHYIRYSDGTDEEIEY